MSNNQVEISMDGLRESLSKELSELSTLIKQSINEGEVDVDVLEHLNEVIAHTNCLNTVSLEGSKTFTNLGHIELPHLEVTKSGECRLIE
ncbi:hypothetical protein J4N45_10220 [Vibrio sp. SCSIO 43140]|uniref:hypothetical protein n=1 Tax=Vibrio sp. SCSIO 43140 TaxID=2819100 RepID=UPI0020754BBC|nr:hypothetical protein [Vibrio sp. SCSIO 43140]USD58904.1 hypothetical protein J4N45_10220 [Vibrio sp. SCSIO 43140]